MKQILLVVWFIAMTVLPTRVAFTKVPGAVFNEEDRQGMHPILSKAWNKGLNVYVNVAQTRDPNIITDKSFYEQRVKEAYNAWFKDTAQHIHAAHREMEFADVYGRLKKGVDVSFNPQATYDLQVHVLSPEKMKKICGSDAAACVTHADDYNPKHPVIYLSYINKTEQQDALKKKDYQSTVTHEVGHTLGFQEQYISAGRMFADAKLSSSQYDPNSIMNGGSVVAPSVSAGDATTFLNLLDAKGLSGNARKGKEWAALGKDDPDKYKDGQRVGSDKQNQLIKSSNGQYYALMTPNGRIPANESAFLGVSYVSNFKSASDILNVKVAPTKTDAKGNILEGKDQYGHKVIYVNFQGYKTRVFLDRGNFVVGIDQEATEAGYGKQYIARVGVNEKISEIYLLPGKDGKKDLYFDGKLVGSYPEKDALQRATQYVTTLEKCQTSKNKDIKGCMSQNLGTSQNPTFDQTAQAAKSEKDTQDTKTATTQNNRQAQQRQNTNSAQNTQRTNNTTAANTQRQPTTNTSQSSKTNASRTNIASTSNSVMRPASSTLPSNYKYTGSDGNQIIGAAH